MFLPIFYVEGRAAVNRGDVRLEKDPFSVLLAVKDYAPAPEHALLEQVQGFEARGDNYFPGGVELPKMLVQPVGGHVTWGAGIDPTVFPNVTIEDFGWAIGYCRKNGCLMFYARLGEQSVSGVDVTLAWNRDGIGIERIVGE